jgi:hypothetical protein
MKLLPRLFLLPFLTVGFIRAAEPGDDDSSWRFSVGPQWRELGRLDVRPGSMAAQSSLPWLAGRGSGNSFTPGIPLGKGNHNYDDGFVREDSSGGAFGSTWNWGYDNASQLRGTTLVFHSANGGGTTTTTAFDSSFSLSRQSWSQEMSGPGFFTEIETPSLLKFGVVRATFTLGYSLAQATSGHSTSAVLEGGQQTRSNSQATAIQDSYDTGGIVVPSAPYAGTFLGPGPLIADTPFARTTSPGASSTSISTALFRSDVTESLRMTLHTISLGPKFSVRCCSRVRCGLGLGLALNVADWSGQYNETVYGNGSAVRRFHQDTGGTAFLPGFYLEPTIEVDIVKHFGVFVSGRYDWDEVMRTDLGPSKARFAPGGWSVLSGVRFTF